MEGTVVDRPARPSEPLAALAERSGQEWATLLKQQLADEGRRAVGGWPGTLAEARIRAEGLLADVGSTESERNGVAAILYEAARDSWMKGRERGPFEPL